MASDPYNPAIHPHTGTSGHPSHCDYSGKREKKRGSGRGRKITKALTLETTTQRKSKGRTMLFPTWFQIAATRRPHNLR